MGQDKHYFAKGPKEKQNNTIGRPTIVHYRKVMDGILYMFLGHGVSGGKCCLKNMVLVLHVISDFLKNGFS